MEKNYKGEYFTKERLKYFYIQINLFCNDFCVVINNGMENVFFIVTFITIVTKTVFGCKSCHYKQDMNKFKFLIIATII